MIAPIFLTLVKHNRPKVNGFNYNTLSAIFDLEQLEQFNTNFFAYNRPAVFSLYNKDYLPGREGKIKDKLISYLEEQEIRESWSRIELVTCPRFLFYVFNPVSFYLLYRQNSKIPQLCVAEVNNTFGETHLYIAKEAGKKNKFLKFVSKKDFHVSPFYDRSGEYEFYVYRDEIGLEIRVNLKKESKTVFTSSVEGEFSYPKSNLEAITWGLKYVWLTFPRIVWQAAKLKFINRLKVYSKPIASSSWTIRKRKASIREKIAAKIIFNYFSKITKGKLTIVLPNGEKQNFGSGLKQASLKINDWSFFTRLLLGADIAFGECYADGLIDSDNLTKVLEIFAENSEEISERSLLFSKLNQFINKIKHRLNFNSEYGSKKNISAHYDLGNRLFKEFLDPNLVYSSAVFDDSHMSLAEAQKNKIEILINKAELCSEQQILEIGSGWGAFAFEVAKNKNIKITTATLSNEQYNYVKAKIDEQQLADKVEIKLCDYRALNGVYDRIVSIEMLEAVGHENLPTYFEKCNSLLKSNGLLVLQVITFPDSRYEEYRKSCDWIQKYIFPGGLCPSLSAIAKASEDLFEIKECTNIAKSYSRTLQEWRKNFNNKALVLEKMGYDKKFQRIWNYYFSYCEAGFNSDILGTMQIVMKKKV